MTKREGIQDCIALVKSRKDYYESYRCLCPANQTVDGVSHATPHLPGCKGETMATKPATFAALDEALLFLEAYLEHHDAFAWKKHLARNLVVAATLTRAFEIGVYAAASWTSGQLDGQNAWEPGCGRVAAP